jgi:hypothetical protein
MSLGDDVPHATVVSWQDLRIGISAPAAGDLEWLLAFLTPWFDLDDGPADCRIELVADDAAYRQVEAEAGPRELVHCFSLDRGALCLPVARNGGGDEVLFDARLRAAYVIERATRVVRIVAPSGNLSARFAAMRIARELAMERARSAGHLLLHAACLAAGDDALLVAAPKGGGKTSVLLGGLLGGGFRFVSNDRVVVRANAPGFVACGIPTLVSVRRPTIDWNAPLRRRLESRATRHWLTLDGETTAHKPADWSASSVDLAPSQVCELLGVEAHASARVRALVFPRLDGTGASAVAELAPSEAADRMSVALFGGGERAPGLFASLLADADRPQSAVAAELAVALPSFELVLGSDRAGVGPALAEIVGRSRPARADDQLTRTA